VTTPGDDTSGANLIVIGVSCFYPGVVDPTVSDSLSNIWTPLTRNSITFGIAHQFFYCFNPTTGAAHTFTSAGTSVYQTVKVIAWYGGTVVGFASETGTTANGVGTMSADLSPTTYGLALSGGALNYNTGDFAVAGGGTNSVTQFSFGNYNGGGLAYDASSAGFTYAPVWTWTAGGYGAMSNAQFTFTPPCGPAMGGRFHRIVTRPAAFRPGIAR
jgi:hypothetical protein